MKVFNYPSMNDSNMVPLMFYFILIVIPDFLIFWISCNLMQFYTIFFMVL